MQQFEIKFNPEQFTQTYSSLVSLKQNDLFEDFKCKRRNNLYDYHARKYSEEVDINNYAFFKLRKIKLYNILPVLDLYKEEKMFVTQDFHAFTLDQQDPQEKEKNYIAAILAITLQELCRREVPFAVKPENVVLLDNHVCLQQIDFDFTKTITPEDSFQSYAKLVTDMIGQFDLTSFEEAANYFMELCGAYLGPSENMPYADFLTQIFDFQNVKELAEPMANSYVYEFDTPDFMKTIPGLSQKIVLKSSKLDIADEEYLILSSQRELEIMEMFQKYEPFVACFAYFRIQKQLYLFMERFPQDLDQAFRNCYLYERNIKGLCCQLAVAIKHLHRHQILHRDLKPNNIFLSHEELDRAQALIADFDHSRSTSSGSNDLTGLSATRNYDPPESGRVDYDFSSDIWQIGMIFYQIANEGKYPVEIQTLAFTEDDYKKLFTYEKIAESLKDKGTDEDFIKVIASCLSFQNTLRPTANQLIDMLIECFGDLDIDDEETMQSTHQINMVESYGKLIQRSRPRFLLQLSGQL